MNKFVLLFVYIAACVMFAQRFTNAADDVIHLEVAAGEYDREGCVVQSTIPANFKQDKHLELIRLKDGAVIPVQLEQTAQGSRIFWILQKKLLAQKSRRYDLHAVEKPKPKQATTHAVTLKVDNKQVLIKVGEKPVLVYNVAVVPSPLKDQPYYARSGYIHPLYTPSGKEITDDFNPDHAHQHGVMFAWRKILFDGRHCNGWEQKELSGRVESAGVKSVKVGPVFAKLTASLKHIDLTAKQGPVTMLNETWQVQVYAFSDHFLFDITSTQTCASDKPVVIEKYHYGGMTIRGHADWLHSKAFNFFTSEGKTRIDGNHTRPNWVEMNGPLKGEHEGVTIMGHPENFRAPQPVRLHPNMPYFCFAPAHVGEFRIEPGKPFVSKYRYHVHSGKPNGVVAKRIWADYTQPPKVQIVN